MSINIFIKIKILSIFKKNTLKSISVNVGDESEPKVILMGKVWQEEDKINAEILSRAVVGTAPVINKIVNENENNHLICDIDRIKSKIAKEININKNNIKIQKPGKNKILVEGTVDQYWKKIRIEEQIYKIANGGEVESKIIVETKINKDDKKILCDILKSIIKNNYEALDRISIVVVKGIVIIRGEIENINLFVHVYHKIIYMGLSPKATENFFDKNSTEIKLA